MNLSYFCSALFSFETLGLGRDHFHINAVNSVLELSLGISCSALRELVTGISVRAQNCTERSPVPSMLDWPKL